MDFKKLEKATNTYREIQSLDKEIIEIERFAMLVANGEIKSSFELKIEDIGKQKQDEQKVSIDSDGSLMLNDYEEIRKHLWGGIASSMISFGRSEMGRKKENEHTINYSISENATLQILGVLLCEKHDKRKSLLLKLHNLGVSV